jgi:superfamily II DNA or RNA helicase
MYNNYSPKPTQLDLINAVTERLKKENETAIVSPTGSGKTILAAHLIAEYAKRYNPTLSAEYDKKAWCFRSGYKQIIFVVHLDSLVMQTYRKFQNVFKSRFLHMGEIHEENMDMGITFIKSGLEFQPNKPIIIASLQSLNKRYEDYKRMEFLKPALIIFDECHTTSFSETGQKIINELGFDKRIGLTATPFRLEKDVAFNKVWNNCIVAPSFREMVKRGELCPITYKTFISASELKQPKRGEFKEKEVIEKFNTPTRINYALDIWEKEAKHLKSLFFTVNVDHGNNVKEELLKRGYRVEIISYKTDKKDREPTYKKFESGELQILISVVALSIGFDEPSCECGVDLQPTTSIAKQWQKIGRIARLSPGKTKALWLEFTGNIERLGDFGIPDNIELTEEVVLSDKDYTKREGTAPIKMCEHCHTINHASRKTCIECGEEFLLATILDELPTGGMITIVNENMVSKLDDAIFYYRNLRKKRYLRNEHPNAAYHEYKNTGELAKNYPIPHPRERVEHKQWAIGAITDEPSNFETGILFLDKIIQRVRKRYSDERIIEALVDSAIWLEFDDAVYNLLKLEIKNYPYRQKFAKVGKLTTLLEV